MGFGLTAIAAAASLGELVAACVGLHLLSKLRGMRIHLPALAGSFVLFSLTAAWSMGMFGASPQLSTAVMILITLTIIGAVTLFVSLRNTRSPQHEAIP